ncbi:hypothetical protein RF11_13397 [Thelohanellus kitauei]|uniref:Uncharacterized protein n=1 Tax=Thelohanellus kitauei TaxID=669202 RepID=A0A0C2M779_THEKT|nr:hypothetical protein RF11_13397 [Thelohanellus kitauei]
MFVISTIASFFSAVLAIFGYRKPQFRKIVGGLILTSAIALGILSFAYTSKVIWLPDTIDFISSNLHSVPQHIKRNQYIPTLIIFLMWPMTIVFVMLGILLFVHKFEYEEIIDQE